MMWIDDLIADLIDDRLAIDLEIFVNKLGLQHCVANGVPSYVLRRAWAPWF
jgi:hypothetical protein